MTMATNTEASGGEDVRLAAIARGNASPPPAVAVDTAMGCAVSSTLPADAGFTTLESVSYTHLTLPTNREV